MITTLRRFLNGCGRANHTFAYSLSRKCDDSEVSESSMPIMAEYLDRKGKEAKELLKCLRQLKHSARVLFNIAYIPPYNAQGKLSNTDAFNRIIRHHIKGLGRIVAD